MAKSKKVSRTLVGTYRRDCKAWIQKQMLYNYPVGPKSGNPAFETEKIKNVFLHNRNAKLLKFAASFSKNVSVSELKALGYPISDKPRSDTYALFELKSYDVVDTRAKETTNKNTVCSYQFVVSLNDFATTDEDKSILSHWLHNKGTPFAKPYEKRTKQLLSQELMDHFTSGSVVCESAAQQTFFPELFDVPFPPPENPAFTFIDLFAGIGGFRLAMQSLGGKCVFSSEWDLAAQKTYSANYGELPFGDIRKEEIKNLIPDGFDVLCAGFPCQPFSLAGVSARKALSKAHGFECKTQGTLFFDVMKIVSKKRPRVIFLENVRNLKNHDNGHTFSTIEETIKAEGYSFHWALIDASPVVPQKRVRCYMVCVRDKDIFNFPDVTGKELPLSSILEKNVGPEFTISDRLWAGHQNRTQRNLSRGVGFTAFCADITKPSHTLVARYYKDGKECLVPQLNNNPRMLTPRECARLQGYPDDFILHLSRAVAYKQLGNSVAVPVVKIISQAIYKQLLEKEDL